MSSSLVSRDPGLFIFSVRGHKIILDADLAALYDVSTKALNQAVKRNAERFPPAFMFQLTADELEAAGGEMKVADFHRYETGGRSAWILFQKDSFSCLLSYS